MRKSVITVGAAAVLGLSAFVAPLAAGADTFGHGEGGDGGHAVFVQTNDPSGNQVVSYVRRGDGQLSYVGRFSTGGLGVALAGASADKLASQGGLAYDASARLLFAVNGGSNTVTEFHVRAGVLYGARSVASGGTIPVSVTAANGRFYVLNAGGSGSVQGFSEWTLAPIANTARGLGLTPGLTPQFLNTPGQIGLTPDGQHLVVTTKLNGSDVDVFGVGAGGALTVAPTVFADSNPVPFGFSFDQNGDLVLTEAGVNALSTYAIAANGVLTPLASVTNGQHALCWVTSAGAFFYGANAGSGTVTGYAISGTGTPSVLGETTTDPGPIDLAASSDGTALYVETGQNGIVDGFTVNSDGSLTFTGSVAPLLPGHTGIEGIVAS